MKTWEKAEVVELNMTETENGGKPSQEFDNQWYDEQGNLHQNYLSQS